MKKIDQLDTITKSKGKILGVFEDDWSGQIAISKDKDRYFIGRSDSNWIFKELKIREGYWQSPWPLTGEESKEISRILKENGLLGENITSIYKK